MIHEIFYRPKFLLLIVAVMLIAGCSHKPKHPFEYAAPETKGFSSEKLDILKAHLEQSGASSMMLLEDGEVILDWGESGRKLTIHSIRKCLLNSLTGRSIYELFLKEIAKPLGMHDYHGKYTDIDGEAEGVEIPRTDGFYQYEKNKSLYPAYHFRLSARDLALYGKESKLYRPGGLKPAQSHIHCTIPTTGSPMACCGMC